MENPLKDKRYKVIEQGSKYLATFEGESITTTGTEKKAWLECIFHDNKRLNKPIL